MEFERKVNKISDFLYSIEEGVVRWFVLIGDEKAVVIDTGLAGEGALKLAETLTDRELILLNTHGDVDHVSGNADFESVYISEEDYKDFNFSEKYPDLKPVFVTDGQIIELGNRTLEIITVKGHTKGSIAVLDKTGRSLYAGDTVSDDKIFMFGHGRVPEAFGDSLKKLIARSKEFDRIYAAHGTCELGKNYAAENLADWDKVYSGKVMSEDFDFFGEPAKAYKTDSCVFVLK